MVSEYGSTETVGELVACTCMRIYVSIYIYTCMYIQEQLEVTPKRPHVILATFAWQHARDD